MNTRFTKSNSLVFSFFILVLLLSSGVIIAQANKSSTPSITTFSAVPTIKTVDSIDQHWNEIRWKTTDAERVILYKNGKEMKSRSQLANGEIGWPLSMEGGIRFKGNNPAQYKLVAENSFGLVSEKLDTKLLSENSISSGLPEILNFNIELQNSSSGDIANFYWQTKGAHQVRLFDDVGEIESRIELSNGTYGWPLEMNGEMKEALNRSVAYRIVATNEAGSVSKSFKVTVVEKSCKVVVSITGTYSKSTAAVGVLQVIAGNPDKFIFKSPVSTVRDHRDGKKAQYQKASITLTPGEYNLVPVGGGKDAHGDFGVIYKPGKAKFICDGGNSGKVSFISVFAEY
jgi:hypothetical protein